MEELQLKFKHLNDPLEYKCEIYKGDQLATDKELLDQKKELLNITKKNPLHAIAFIQKLAEAKDLEAAFIQCIYHTYKKFLVDGNLNPLDQLITLILSRHQESSLKKELADYIKTILEGDLPKKEHLKAQELLNQLIPGFEKTILSDAYKVMPETVVEVKNKKYAYQAFPDLIKFENSYYIAFREGKSHADYKELGKVIILKAEFKKITNSWKFDEIARLSHQELDLRDPKFFINHDQKLMLIMCGCKFNKKAKATEMTPYVAHVKDKKWQLEKALLDKKKLKKGEWIWHITYNPHDGFCYGFSYGFNKKLSLLKSKDGITFTEVTKLNGTIINESLNEATIRFKKDGTLVALIRAKRHGLIAHSKKEDGYIKWDYSLLPFHLGGPNFLIEPNEEMIAGTRYFFLNPDNTLDLATVAAYMDEKSLIPFMRFYAKEDNSYPGMVLEENGEITFLYYSGDSKNCSNLLITRFMP